MLTQWLPDKSKRETVLCLVLDSSLDSMGFVRNTIGQAGRQALIAEDLRPATKLEIASDGQCCVFVRGREG